MRGNIVAKKELDTAKTPSKSRVRKKQESVRERTVKNAIVLEKKTLKQKLKALIMLPFKLVFKLIGLVFYLPVLILKRLYQIKPVGILVRFLAKILLINYVVNSWKELKQVEWPSHKQTIRLSIAVFLFSVVFGMVISLVDYGLDKVIRRIVFRS